MAHTRKILFYVLVILGAMGPPLCSAQQDALAGFDQYVMQALKDWDIPGVAIAIVRGDSVVLCRGFGVRTLGEPAAVDDSTVFAIASCTKAFTAAALAMLVDEGTLGWDDRVTTHLPWFQLHDPYVTREMTVRDLLTHRSGLPPYGGDLMWWGTHRSREEILRRVRFVPPASSFRSTYAYNNIMFIAAGEIIPAVTGIQWEDFVQERIFHPLGMERSSVSTPVPSRTRNLATPHMRINGKVQVIARRNVDNGGPAGSINSTVRDLAQWIRLQLGNGRFQGRQVFSEKACREMRTPQTVIPLPSPSPTLGAPMPHFQAYGLGWGLRDYRGRTIVRHFGETDGISSLVALVPEERLGMAILTNIHVASMHHALLFYIIDAYLGPPRDDWSARFLAAAHATEDRDATQRKKLEAQREEGTTPSLPLRQYIGTYGNDVYGTATVEEKAGKLTVRLSATPTCIGELEHWHYDLFESSWYDPVFERGFVVFVPDGQGHISHMKLRVADFVEPSEYVFNRIPDSAPATPR